MIRRENLSFWVLYALRFSAFRLFLQTGDFDSALGMAQKDLGSGGERRDWVLLKGNVLSRRGRYQEAVRQYTLAIDQGKASHQPYCTGLTRIFVSVKLNEAFKALRASQRGATPGSWLGKILACLAGELTPDELVAAADPTNVEQVCESYHYAGEVHLLKGHSAQARMWFQKCVASDLAFDVQSSTAPMNEYHLARCRLKTLSEGQ